MDGRFAEQCHCLHLLQSKIVKDVWTDMSSPLFLFDQRS